MTILKKVLLSMMIMSAPAFASDQGLDAVNSRNTAGQTVIDHYIPQDVYPSCETPTQHLTNDLTGLFAQVHKKQNLISSSQELQDLRKSNQS